jgi:carboxyl-terminal processing protease
MIGAVLYPRLSVRGMFYSDKLQILRIVLCVIFSALLPAMIQAQNNKSPYSEQAFLLAEYLKKFHYQPQVLDKQLSQKIFDNFIEDLDPSGLYFTSEDYKVLEQWRDRLDVEILEQKSDFLETTSKIYRSRLRMSDSLVSILLSVPQEFTGKDTLLYSSKNKQVKRPMNTAEAKNKWSKRLKYQVLKEMFAATEAYQNPFDQDLKVILAGEEKARAKVLKSTKRSIARHRNPDAGFENEVASRFFNAFVECYDPHSAFFTAPEKESFEEALSTDVYSFGMIIQENEQGEISIVHLTPGGAAWRSSQMHVGDVFLKIKLDTDVVHDVSLMEPEEALELFAGISAKQAEFTIRKDNGQVKSIRLVKTKVKSEENVVRSFVLSGEKKIGYISLPAFYSDLQTNSPLGCANDVAKEILKLQNERIEGLIFDLRYNGGGSVDEAVALAGIFIDEGPLFVFKEREQKPRLLKDINRGTAYNGPLLVMVNGLSASASELFSAALQDYRRALIVGSPTYGKATGQVILPLDTAGTLKDVAVRMQQAGAGKNGYVKLTIEKFFRVTNKTHQKHGVIPDLQLPEPFYFAEYKEANYPSALSADSIVKKVVYAPLKELPVVRLV